MKTTKNALSKTNTSTALTPFEIERKEILDKANDDFKEMYEKIKSHITNEEISIFDSRYKIGEMLFDMNVDESRYGSKAVQRMEKVIGVDRNIIYTSALFYKRYTEEQLEELKKLRNRVDEPLTWSHIAALVRVKGEEDREAFQKAALEDCLTAQQLIALIQKKNGGPSISHTKAGKPMARPKSVKAFIENQMSQLTTLLNRKNKVWAGTEKSGDMTFFDTIDATPASKFDEDLMSELESLIKCYKTVSTEMEAMARKVEAAVSRIEKSGSEAEELGDTIIELDEKNSLNATPKSKKSKVSQDKIKILN